MSWGSAAWQTMGEVRANCIKEGKTPEETAKAIDAAYPFGERAYYPYKAWLAARKSFFATYNLPIKTSKKKAPDLFLTEGGDL